MLDQHDARAVTAWLYRTSTRLALDRLRGRRRDTARGAAIKALDRDDRSPESALLVTALLGELEKRVPAQELEAALPSSAASTPLRNADGEGADAPVRHLLGQQGIVRQAIRPNARLGWFSCAAPW